MQNLARLILPAFLLLQSPAPTAIGEVVDLGTRGGFAAIVIWMWREDRKSREAQQKAADLRYTQLVNQVVDVLQRNSVAMGALSRALQDRPCMQLGDQG